MVGQHANPVSKILLRSATQPQASKQPGASPASAPTRLASPSSTHRNNIQPTSTATPSSVASATLPTRPSANGTIHIYNQPQPTNRANMTKIISYGLPNGWATARSSDNAFEVGYDPTRFRVEIFANNPGVYLTYKDAPAGPYTHIVFVGAYDGGSRHQAIYKATLSNVKPGYEEDYIVNGRPALVQYDIADAGGKIWSKAFGVMVIDNERAFYINSGLSEQGMIEETLATLKVL
jgi:hypothetical protein